MPGVRGADARPTMGTEDVARLAAWPNAADRDRVAPDHAGNFPDASLTPSEMLEAVEDELADSPNLPLDQLAARLGVLADDPAFLAALRTLRPTYPPRGPRRPGRRWPRRAAPRAA